MGETLGELGLAFIKLTKFENEEAVFNSQRVRAADMKGFATAAVKASRFYRELNAQTVKHLVNCKTFVLDDDSKHEDHVKLSLYVILTKRLAID